MYSSHPQSGREGGVRQVETETRRERVRNREGLLKGETGREPNRDKERERETHRWRKTG